MAPDAWLDQHLGRLLVHDAAFAEAYAFVGARERAWLKTCAAQALDARPRLGALREVRGLTPGGVHRVERAMARPWALLLLGADMASPVRPVAAACAARLAGVEQVAAVFLAAGGEQPPLPVLAALELAGVEQVASAAAPDMAELATALAQCPEPGVLLALGHDAGQWSAALEPGMRGPCLWRESRMDRVGVWAKDADWDWEALAFCHPDARFVIGGAGECGPLEPHAREESWEGLLGHGLDVLFAAGELLEQALARDAAPLLLGPGCESCWHCSRLTPNVFTRTVQAWGMDQDSHA